MHWSGEECGQLPEHSQCDQRGRSLERGCDPSRIRISVRKRIFRRSVRIQPHQVYRTFSGSYSANGRQGSRAPRDEPAWIAGTCWQRECSIQRRHQKLVEEAPSVIMTSDLREIIGSRVVRAIQDVGYSNVGTIEFLVDESRNFYFMEMNTRIQVEHPVTELVTGIDLVREQILIAAGERLHHRQGDIQFRGHALECRINAEDPVTYKPSPGTITSWHAPGGPGVRVDTAAYAEYVIPPYYDSLIAKLIVHGSTRDEAIRRMDRALDMFVLEGVKTTIPLHRQILHSPEFEKGDIYTNFLEHLQDNRARAVEMA